MNQSMAGFACGQRVRYPAEPDLGVGKVIGVIRTTRPGGDEVRYMAQFGLDRNRRPIIRMGDAGGFRAAAH